MSLHYATLLYHRQGILEQSALDERLKNPPSVSSSARWSTRHANCCPRRSGGCARHAGGDQASEPTAGRVRKERSSLSCLTDLARCEIRCACLSPDQQPEGRQRSQPIAVNSGFIWTTLSFGTSKPPMKLLQTWQGNRAVIQSPYEKIAVPVDLRTKSLLYRGSPEQRPGNDV